MTPDPITYTTLASFLPSLTQILSLPSLHLPQPRKVHRLRQVRELPLPHREEGHQVLQKMHAGTGLDWYRGGISNGRVALTNLIGISVLETLRGFKVFQQELSAIAANIILLDLTYTDKNFITSLT